MKPLKIVLYTAMAATLVSCPAKEKGEKHAVILSTESYADKPESSEFDEGLKNAFLINVANQYDALLKLGYKKENIQVLFPNAEIDTTETTDNEKIKQIKNVSPATKHNLYEALSDISKKIEPEDEFTLIIQGHGRKTRNSSYIAIGEERITPEELNQYAERINASKERYIIDACYSGNFGILANKNQKVFTSSTSESPGIISKKDSFSRFLMNAYLNPEADENKDGKISDIEAFNYAERQRQPYLKQHEEAGHTYKYLYDLEGFKGQKFSKEK